jgi:hypothetical protein
MANQTIQAFTLTPHPETADIYFYTQIPCTPIVKVFEKISDDPAQDSLQKAMYVNSPVGNTKKYRHYFTANRLQQDTSYWVIVDTNDDASNSEFETIVSEFITVSFTTNTRQAIVSFEQILIGPDGDPDFYGAGDFVFQMGVYGKQAWNSDYKLFSNSYRMYYGDYSAYQVILQNQIPSFTIDNAPRYLAFPFAVFENDSWGVGYYPSMVGDLQADPNPILGDDSFVSNGQGIIMQATEFVTLSDYPSPLHQSDVRKVLVSSPENFYEMKVQLQLNLRTFVSALQKPLFTIYTIPEIDLFSNMEKSMQAVNIPGAYPPKGGKDSTDASSIPPPPVPVPEPLPGPGRIIQFDIANYIYKIKSDTHTLLAQLDNHTLHYCLHSNYQRRYIPDFFTANDVQVKKMCAVKTNANPFLLLGITEQNQLQVICIEVSKDNIPELSTQTTEVYTQRLPIALQLKNEAAVLFCVNEEGHLLSAKTEPNNSYANSICFEKIGTHFLSMLSICNVQNQVYLFAITSDYKLVKTTLNESGEISSDWKSIIDAHKNVSILVHSADGLLLMAQTLDGQKHFLQHSTNEAKWISKSNTY